VIAGFCAWFFCQEGEGLPKVVMAAYQEMGALPRLPTLFRMRRLLSPEWETGIFDSSVAQADPRYFH
jgi:hypothetical protein